MNIHKCSEILTALASLFTNNRVKCLKYVPQQSGIYIGVFESALLLGVYEIAAMKVLYRLYTLATGMVLR